MPPYVPSYFNAGHHLPLFQVGAYLRKHNHLDEVACVDAAALNLTWKEICDIFASRFDLIAIMNDFDGIDSFRRTVKYARTLSPGARLLTFGRLSKQIPMFFERYGFDGIHVTGDYESGVSGYLEHLRGLRSDAPGVLVKEGDSYVAAGQGIFLPPDEWGMPDITEIPYEAYDNLYIDDTSKFCGIPQRRELVIQVARGCPVGCSFCDVPTMQGLKERRLRVSTLMAYIHDAFARLPFEYVSFYAPTFTLNKPWVYEFCGDLSKMARPYPWKCVTTMYHLDSGLVEEMAAAGCFRISVGLETLSPSAYPQLPRLKRHSARDLMRMASVCNDNGVELNCFVILGLPGDEAQNVAYTIRLAESLGCRVRPTIYTPYEKMNEDMSEEEVASFNRQLFADGVVSQHAAHEYYSLFYNRLDNRATQVMDLIPQRA